MEKLLPTPFPIGRDMPSRGCSLDSLASHYHRFYIPALNRLNALCSAVKGQFPLEELLKTRNLPTYCGAEIQKEAKNVFCHQQYFSSLSQHSSDFTAPSGLLFEKLKTEFGSYSGFFHAVLLRVQEMEMPGFLWLVADAYTQKPRLEITKGYELPKGNYRVLFALDLWEHAWIFQDSLTPLTYVEEFFHILDMKRISKEYEDFYADFAKGNERKKR